MFRNQWFRCVFVVVFDIDLFNVRGSGQLKVRQFGVVIEHVEVKFLITVIVVLRSLRSLQSICTEFF